MSDLAAQQLADLADVSGGAIQVLGSVADDKSTVFSISLNTAGVVTSGSGISVRSRERFEILVDPSYPHSYPSVMVRHRRWAGTPHVQWGSLLCLYAAPSVEWNPADGMRGLVSRLMLWLQRAAAGELDPAGQPLHPPIAYGSYANGWIVLRPDLGDLVPWRDPGGDRVKILYAWCVQKGSRVDVLEWLTPLQIFERVIETGDEASCDAAGRPLFAAPAIVISDTLDMEYPATAAALAEALDGYGVPREALLTALVRASTVNKALGHDVSGVDAVPAMMLLATPARRLDPGEPLAHITSWHLDDLGSKITDLLQSIRPENEKLAADVRELAESWLGFAKVHWMIVHEARSEVTRRRDTGSVSAWLTGKRILLLGAGALGAPIAEQCVRAGVTALHVIDKGTVGPGILVRQPYDDDDIGYNKAERLAARLSRVRDDLTVTASRVNVVTGILQEPEQVLTYDLVIDATADVGVRTALEAARAPQRAQWPATIGAVFGHTAERGLVAVSLPGATGATHDILRRTAIDITANPPTGWVDIAEDFFPATPRTDMFFPEPGCSSPTFTGSSTQTAALAAGLLWAALRVLTDSAAAPMTAVAVHLAPPASGHAPRPLSWSNDAAVTDQSGQYEVLLSARALTEIRAEARRGARIRGADVETGGMLLGAIDDATRTVHVDAAAGPPPDSHLSPIYLDHGVDGTQELVDASLRQTGARVGFVGMWHTHPYGPARPSDIDDRGMSQIVTPRGSGRRALMIILGGPSREWDEWLQNGTPPRVYARVVRREDATGRPSTDSPYYLTIGETYWFPGGFTYPSTARVER